MEATAIDNLNSAIAPLIEPPITARPKESFPELVGRLSYQSVVKHFNAYEDIAWDSPQFQLDPHDPRWELKEDDALGGTAWYRSQPQEIRARIGLHMVTGFMKVGINFEGILKRGLLGFADTLPNNSPEFRYIYHEVAEEVQHSLMFQEFVNRSGIDVPGLTGLDRLMAGFVIRLGRAFPELFFFFVLGGEDPIDHVQRKALRRESNVHPLLRRIMQIHVTEEARHLCFARHYLKEHVPQLSGFRRAQLAYGAPLILGQMAQLMMRPSGRMIRQYQIPGDVIAEAYTNNPRHRANTIEALGKVRALCDELALLTPGAVRIWKRFGIWEELAAGEA